MLGGQVGFAVVNTERGRPAHDHRHRHRASQHESSVPSLASLSGDESGYPLWNRASADDIRVGDIFQPAGAYVSYVNCQQPNKSEDDCYNMYHTCTRFGGVR